MPPPAGGGRRRSATDSETVRAGPAEPCLPSRSRLVQGQADLPGRVRVKSYGPSPPCRLRQARVTGSGPSGTETVSLPPGP